MKPGTRTTVARIAPRKVVQRNDLWQLLGFDLDLVPVKLTNLMVHPVAAIHECFIWQNCKVVYVMLFPDVILLERRKDEIAVE